MTVKKKSIQIERYAISSFASFDTDKVLEIKKISGLLYQLALMRVVYIHFSHLNKLAYFIISNGLHLADDL